MLNVGGLTGDGATKQFNGLLKQVATAHGAKFANPLPVFNPSSNFAGASETLDIPVICTAHRDMCPGGTVQPGEPGDIAPERISATGSSAASSGAPGSSRPDRRHARALRQVGPGRPACVVYARSSTSFVAGSSHASSAWSHGTIVVGTASGSSAPLAASR